MGSAFGPFDLERLLGRGGMAEAFLARRADGGSGDAIVLKRIRPDLARETEYLRRFVLEAQVASRLSHPNLVRFLEFGRVGDCHYICMAFVRGRSLERLLARAFQARRPPPLPVALHLGVGLFDGLAVMHGVRDDQGQPRPMLHRDVTPANIIVAEDGRPVIIDFGIAKDVMGPAITIPGKVIGTARYMAPEHRRAEFIDARADVFSASTILFELLTGRHPWPALESMKELLRTTFDPPELTREVRAHIPDDLEPILLKGLECDPERRFVDAQAMGAALRQTRSFASSRDLGARAVLHWIDDQGLDLDESLEGPVVQADMMDGLRWTDEGFLSTGSIRLSVQVDLPEAAPDGDDGEDPTARPRPRPQPRLPSRSATPSSGLDLPPLPPRRDAVLGHRSRTDDLALGAGARARGPLWLFGALFLLVLGGVLWWASSGCAPSREGRGARRAPPSLDSKARGVEAASAIFLGGYSRAPSGADRSVPGSAPVRS